MDDLRSFLRHQLWRVAGVGALGCLVHLPLSAQTPLEMPTRLDRFHVFSNGNIVSNQYASRFEAEGIRLSQNARVFGTATTGGVSLSKQLAINTKNGIVVAEAVQKIGARQIGRAFAGALGGPLAVGLLLAPEIIGMLDAAQLTVEDGQVMKPPTSGPNAWSPLPTFSPSGAGALPSCPNPVTNWFTLGYCKNVSGSTAAIFGYVTTATKNSLVSQGWNWTNNMGDFHHVNRGGLSTSSLTTGPGVVATPQEIEDAIAPTNPTAAALKTLGDAGVVPMPDSSDPAKVQNPQPSPQKTTTRTNPDGSTETTVCQTTGTVQGNSVKLKETCTITKRDPSGNLIDTTTTTTDQDPAPGSQDEKSLFCELFPKVLACAEFGTPEQTEIPKLERNVTYTEEVLFGGGTCPADTVVNAYGMALTVGHWSMWCGYVVSYVRPIVLLLGAFAAMMIVALGKPE